MNIVVGSAWRSSAKNVARYIKQVRALADRLEHDVVRVVAAEGDSRDDTRNTLVRRSTELEVSLQIVDTSFGDKHFGSVEDPARMSSLSKVGNAIFNAVTDKDDVLLYVESDLVWDPHTMAELIYLVHNRHENFDVIAPMIFAGDNFYDVWAFRKNGDRFAPFPPYHRELNKLGITPIDSAGSCLVMRREVAQNVRIKNGNALVGWCDEARAQGYVIGVHANLWINHPAA